MTTTSRTTGLVAALAAAALASALVGQPAQARPSTDTSALAVAEQKPDCGELFLLLVPGAGEDAGPGTTLGRLRIRQVMRWPRPEVRVVSWRNTAPTPALLRQAKDKGLGSAYFAGWRRAVDSTKRALVRRTRVCPQEALIVAGYSQGAAIARVALHELRDTPRVVRRLGSLVLVGDPMASASQRAVVTGGQELDGITGRTLPLPRLLARGLAVASWCRPGDPVCSRARIGRGSLRAHFSYADAVEGQGRVRGNVASAVGWLQVFPTSSFNAAYLGDPMQLELPPDHAPPAHEQRYAVEQGALPGGLAIDGAAIRGTPTEETFRMVTFRTWSQTIAPALHRTFPLTFKLIPRSTARPGTVQISNSALGDVSADGRYVVFSSSSSTKAPNDTNGDSDVFRYDRMAGTTVLLSRTPQGSSGDGSSFSPRVSADGRYVVYSSNARNLDPAAAGGSTRNVYLWDAATGQNTLLSRPNAGGASTSTSDQPWISDDGTQVVFHAGAGNLVPDGQAGLVRWRSATGTVERVGLPAGGSWIGEPWVASADGRYAAVAGTGSTMRVFDLQTSSQVGSCTLPVVPGHGAGELSLDGRTLAGWFGGSGSPAGFTGRCDTASGTATALLGQTSEPLRAADLTRDGSLAATLDGDYPSPDGFRHLDVRVWTPQGGSTSGLVRPAVSSAPHSDIWLTRLRMAMSGDGSVVAFEGQVENILPATSLYEYTDVDIYLWDRTVSP